MNRYKKLSFSSVLSLLWISILVLVLLYLTINTYGNWSFALKLRGKKILAFLIVGISSAISALSFQTITHNKLLTPSILGLDSLYVLTQTFIYYMSGNLLDKLRTHTQLFFIGNIILMVMFSCVLFYIMLIKRKPDVYLLLMIGMVLGTFFRSLSTFMQVAMNPNEYDKLQGKLFANFNNISVSLLPISGLIIIVCFIYLFKSSNYLDVLELGDDQASSLGVDVPRFQLKILVIVSCLTAVSTALVGPITFLGFIIANVTYQLCDSFHHNKRFLVGSLLGFMSLVLGQLLVEQVFHLKTTLSVVVEFVGGLYFLFIILKERKKNA